MTLENFSEHIILCKWAYLFSWKCSLLSTKATTKWRNSHNHHVNIFYLIYVNHLIENIFRTVSFFFTFRTIEKLFFVLSYIRFYEMNFFHWNLMPWEAFIPKYSLFFRATRKKFSAWQVPGKLPGWKCLRVTRKNTENLGINASHGIKFQ